MDENLEVASSSAFTPDHKYHAAIVCLAIVIGTSIKLFYALTTIGTNDVVYWATFMDYIVENGSVSIYKSIWYYNHPPLISLMLFILHNLQDYFHNGFPFLIRLPAILADIGSCILAYKILKTYQDAKYALFAAVIVALSPILIFVSGFHGNIDPVFMFLILLSTYFYLKRDGVVLPASILGLALNIKIIPIITVPAYFFFIKDWKNRLLFCITLSGVFSVGFLYHAIMDFEHLIRNIFSISGASGVWGIGQILIYHFEPEIEMSYRQIGILLIFLSVTFSMNRLSVKFQNECHTNQTVTGFSEIKERGKTFLLALGTTFFLFFVFTPSFGVQNLALMVVPAALIGLSGSLIVNAIGGLFLFEVYSFWSGGLPWSYANSDRMGSWHGSAELLALALWLFSLLWMIRLICKKEEKIGAKRTDRLIEFVLRFITLITTIAMFVPFSPRMPGASLDESWAFGINQAVAQGLVFGKEMIFTYGPYTSVFSHVYHPATDFMMISGSFYLALSYWLCFTLISQGTKRRWVLAYYLILAGTRYIPDVPDALFFSFPLLAALAVFKTVHPEHYTFTNKKYVPFFVTAIFAPLGLLPLIKGSLLILCGAISTICTAFFIFHKRKLLAAICVTTPFLSMLLFWLAVGQSAANLPGYFISMAPIASSYTEAMAFYGNPYEIILYLIAATLILLTIILQKQFNRLAKMFIFSIFFVFLFLSFKGGFVRHDVVHVLLASTSIMATAILLMFIFKSRLLLPVFAFSLITGFYINSQHIDISLKRIAFNILSDYVLMWNGVKKRIKDKNWPKHYFDSAVTSLRKQSSFPVMNGTTDIYSVRQSYLIASGNNWFPRPILQSYSSYTPGLAEINRNHIMGENAPDNIIFRVEPIDGRIPPIEDGISWPILVNNYHLTKVIDNFLVLEKKTGINETTDPAKLTRQTYAFGEKVYVPQSTGALFVQIDIDPTVWGHAAKFFYKPSQLQIGIELQNGKRRQYFLIACMAKSGFLLSPLVENTAEFSMLYGERKYLASKRVKSLTIEPVGGKTVFWKSKYTVKFSEIKLPSPIDLSTIYGLDSNK